MLRYIKYGTKTHTEVKNLYNFLLVREYLLTKMDKSGRYEVRGKLAEIGKDLEISLKAIRYRLQTYVKNGWILYDGKHIEIKRLRGSEFRLLRLFKAEREALRESENPAILFADMYKLRVIRYAANFQMKREGEKLTSNKRALDMVCRKSTKYLGYENNLHLSLKTIARRLGYKTAQTGKRYIDRMHSEKLLSVRKEAVPFCKVHEFKKAVKESLLVTHDGDLVSMRGRLFIPKNQPGQFRDWVVCERKQNSYLFEETRLHPTRNRKRNAKGGDNSGRPDYATFRKMKSEMKFKGKW